VEFNISKVFSTLDVYVPSYCFSRHETLCCLNEIFGWRYLEEKMFTNAFVHFQYTTQTLNIVARLLCKTFRHVFLNVRLSLLKLYGTYFSKSLFILWNPLLRWTLVLHMYGGNFYTSGLGINMIISATIFMMTRFMICLWL
jgi:hypothetical protein